VERDKVVKIDGGCRCGTIRYEARVDPAKVVICHCTDCQQLSGSTFRTVVQTNPDTFQLLSGVPKIYVKTCESGNRREQTFCPNCDTPIYSALVGDRARVVVLRVGAIRQRNELTPSDQYWFRSSQPWIAELPTMKKRDKQPVSDAKDALGCS
jgi:hypothetical protein